MTSFTFPSDLENLNKRYHKHRKLPLTSDERKVIGKKKIKEKYEPREEEGDDFSHQQTAVEDFSLPSEDLGLEGLKQRLQVSNNHITRLIAE